MTCGNKKVLVTGATGLIGKELITPLKERGFDIYALTIDKNNPNNGAHYIPCNIFNHEEVQKICTEIKAQYLLNMAWCTTGLFNDNINFDFLASSLNILKHFTINGGKKTVMAGTYAEYGNKDVILKENMTPAPINIYSKTKNWLREIATDFCLNNGIDFAWGRIFSAYGKEADNRRLTGYVITNLLQNKQIIIKSGSLIRDYIYCKDIANAFVSLTDSNVSGIVNICTGIPTTISQYVLKIARIMNKEHLVTFNEEPSTQQKIVVGDNTRLIKELKFKCDYTLDQALKEIIESY